MRLDFLITELNVGGAEKALTELAIGMQQRGHDVRVLSIGSAPSVNRHRLVDRLLASGVPLEFGGFDHWRRLPSAARWLTHRFRERSPEICQSFLFHANCLGAWAAEPSIVGHFVGGLRVAENQALRLAVERRAVGRMRHLTCVSAQVRSFALDRLAAHPERCSVIPNGVDLERYRDSVAVDWQAIGWPADSQVALFVGRLHQQKGIELLQQQFEQLFRRDSGRRLLFIGEGPLHDSLTRWSQEIGADRVRVLAWQNDIAPYLKAATMVVLPSRYEGMPNVVMEAMAAGRPVVFSRVQGSQELLGDETDPRGARQGFPPGDGKAMARLVDDLFHDPHSCEWIGAENQQHVASRFSNPLMVDRYEALYRSL